MKTFTKAAYATHVAGILLLASRESAELAQGMWNPDFCSSDATDCAVMFCESLKDGVDEMLTDFSAVEATAVDPSYYDAQPGPASLVRANPLYLSCPQLA